MSWIILFLAGLFEVCWAVGLKYTDGFTRPLPTLLTVAAQSHALMQRYQPPGSEKRMPVILGEGAYDAWLNARVEKAPEFMRQYAAQWLTANPVETKADKVPKGWLG